MSDRDVVIRVENISKLYRLGEVGTGSLAHDVNRWWHKVRGKEDPYLKIGEVNDRTKPAKQASSKKSLTTEDTEGTERAARVRLDGQAGGALSNPSTSELASDSENTSLIRAANEPRFSGQRNGSGDDAESQKTENFNLKTENSAPKGSDWVYALKDVSFEVKRGEVLGIIGRNGAGKSTLLKILSRVTTQSSGQIKVKGRIASLLEVGTGFHPELTGRENIFLNGAILGMRKAEIARKFDEIVEFSGCARYIDTPVKRYSSGMYVRLAFAVAAHLEPEILIVDEVLAVGDAEFQKKCLGKMKDVAGHGRTILFVSHNMTAVQSLCSRCVLMQNGQVDFIGGTSEAVKKYLSKSGASSHERVWESWDEALGSDVLKIQSIRAVSLRHDGQDASLFDLKTPIDLEIKCRVFRKAKVHLTIHFMTDQGEVAFTSGCSWADYSDPADYDLRCRIPANLLNEMEYSVKLLVIENGSVCSSEALDVISIDVKDLAPRPVGSYHGKEPGPVRPELIWSVSKATL
jgi:lipopolysaccharide transport system ATP-binding protein